MPLVGEALAILNGVRAGQHDLVFVFPGGRRGKPLMSLYKPMMRLKRLSGIDGFYFRDLRRTARTGWADIGIDDSLAERLLNHKDRGVRSTTATGTTTRSARRWSGGIGGYGRS